MEGIVEEASTDTVFAADAMVQEAVAFIKRNCDVAMPHGVVTLYDSVNFFVHYLVPLR